MSSSSLHPKSMNDCSRNASARLYDVVHHNNHQQQSMGNANATWATNTNDNANDQRKNEYSRFLNLYRNASRSVGDGMYTSAVDTLKTSPSIDCVSMLASDCVNGRRRIASLKEIAIEGYVQEQFMDEDQRYGSYVPRTPMPKKEWDAMDMD